MAERCPLCAAARGEVFLRRSAVPVHQNLLSTSEAEARAVRRGDLAMAACPDCGFVFNAAFDPALLSYGEDYENTQGHSGVFARHMDELVDYLVGTRGVREATIVEVGCGKGEFLRRLVERDPGNRGIGFDASYVGEKSALGGRLRFEQRMYDASCAAVKADVVVCRHVIEHVARPPELLAAVRAALAGSPGAQLFFETPCVEWILENEVVWDFFYEHCSLFSAASLAGAFRAAGFKVSAVRRLFGEQYLWIEGSVAGRDEFRAPGAGALAARAAEFAREFDARVGQWRRRIEALRGEGRVAIWGAGAKGATFVDLIDRERQLVDCVVDINPAKQGHFIAGSAHPIVAPQALAGRGIAAALMMNPNYLAEARAQLEREGVGTRLFA